MSESLREVRVLYVEDDSAIREALSKMLKRVVGELYVAKNGEEGLHLFREVSPDIVVSDIRMPVMNGIEMAREIRASDPKAHIVFTTAFSESEYLKEAIELGVDGYLIKPIEKRKLMDKLDSISEAVVNSRQKLSYLKLIHALFDSQKDAVLLVDGNGNIQMSNLAYKNLCFRLECESVDHISALLKNFCWDGGTASEKDLTGRDVSCIVDRHGEIVEFSLGDESFYFEIHAKRIDDLYLIELHDVTAFMNEAKELERENMIDQLTGAYNRKVFEKACRQIEQSGRSACAILVDIDHFKKINDTYGHAVGDEVLKAVVEEIQRSIRSEDYLIRWGGEEFLLLSTTDESGGYAMAQKIRETIQIREFRKVGSVTVSCGVSCKDVESVESFENLVNEADSALYKAKRDGRNRVVCHSLPSE